MASNILQFEPTRLITAINIVDDMLFYSDGVTEPKKINIKKFRGDDTTGEFANVKVDHSSGTTHIYDRPFEERDITVIKEHAGTSNKIFEVTKINEAFDIGRDDLNEADINSVKLEALNEDGNIIPKPAEGLASIKFTSSTLDLVEIFSEYTFGDAQIIDFGILWSQTDKTLQDLILNQGSTTTVNRPGIQIVEKGRATTKQQLVKSNTSSVSYVSSLVAGEICAVAFGKIRGQEKLFYSPVAKSIIIDNAASSTTAPTGFVTNEPSTLPGGGTIFSATFDTDGGSPILDSGFYVSEKRINDNDPAPTVKDLIDTGFVIPAEVNNNVVSIIEKPNPGHTYYYVPFVKNKNGTIYGDGLTETSTATKKISEPGVLAPGLVPLRVNEYSDTSTVLQAMFDGNNKIKTQIHPDSTVTEAGFYFSKEELLAVEDLTGKTFNSGSTVSTDGKVFKVPASNVDFDNGGLYKLDINSVLNLSPGETIAYVPYIIHNQGETTGQLTTFTEPPAVVDPVFDITSSTWNLKPNATNSNGIKPVQVNYQLDLTGFDQTKTIDDIGIIVSRPTTSSEVSKSGNGRWNTVEEIINPDNNFKIKIPKDEFTFEPHAGSTTVGRYTTTNPIEVPAITPSEYQYLSENSIKPLNEDWSAVAYIVSDGKTHYSDVFNIESDASNTNVKDEINKTIFGAPQVKSINTSGEEYSDLYKDGVTLHGKLSNAGSNLQELGFYVSTTKPPALSLSTYEPGIPTKIADGRNPALDAWISSATKYVSTDVSASTANTHLNQTTNDFLDFKATITGLTPETKYYYVPFVNPVQSTNTNGDISYNGSETFNTLLNSRKWGSVGEFVTQRAANTPVNDSEAYITRVFDRIGSNGRTKVNIDWTYINRDHHNNRVGDTGIFIKEASLFPATGTGSSAQTANAATFLNASNRIDFYAKHRSAIAYDSQKQAYTQNFSVWTDDLEAKDYFVAPYFRLRSAIANSSGGYNYLQSFSANPIVGEYAELNLAKHASVADAAIQSFSIIPPDLSKFYLNPSMAGNISEITNRLSAEIFFQKTNTAANGSSGFPVAEEAGFIFLDENPPISASGLSALTRAQFITEFTGGSTVSDAALNFIPNGGVSSNSGYKKFQVTGKEEANLVPSSDGSSGTFSNFLPFYQSFPNSHVGKTYFVLAYIKLKGSSDRVYSDKVESITVENNAKSGRHAIAYSADGTVRIQWAVQTGALYGTYSSFGHNTLPANVRALANSGGYYPGEVSLPITSTVPWYMVIVKNQNKKIFEGPNRTNLGYGYSEEVVNYSTGLVGRLGNTIKVYAPVAGSMSMVYDDYTIFILSEYLDYRDHYVTATDGTKVLNHNWLVAHRLETIKVTATTFPFGIGGNARYENTYRWG